MELVSIAVTTAVAVACTAVGKAVVCIYALKGTPARDRPEIIRALARLFGRQEPPGEPREPDGDP
ncbi:hypothetical protein ACWDSJ_09910 [Nocardia sp. NPDC003482]|uniref:hypothetical protein n=1 Tax=Nocardia sp. NPDC004068 TaxID=3364303 RepID=UPI0036B94611